MVERRAFGRGDRGLKPPVVEETLKAVGPFYLVSKLGWGSKISHTGGKCVTCLGLKEWWSLSLVHRFPAREWRRAGLTTLLRSPVIDRKNNNKKTQIPSHAHKHT